MPAPSGLKIGMAIPQAFSRNDTDIALIRRFAQRAELLGFDDLWALEHTIGEETTLEPLTLLSYIAACTERPRLGTAVLVTNLHNPVQLAKAVTSLDHLSAGRLTLGIGLGTNTNPYPTFGVPREHRVSRFVEGIEVMRALWTRPRASLDGRFWQLDGIAMEPKPLQQPHPPLWFGARVPDAMRRAARLGNGWMGAGSAAIEVFIKEIGAMRAILREEGIDEATFPLSKRVYIAIDNDAARGHQRMADWLRAFYGDLPGIESWAVTGDVAACLHALRRLRQAGLSHVMLNAAFEHEEHLEIIARDIVPEL